MGHEHKLLSPLEVNALGLPGNWIFAFLTDLIKKIDNFTHGHKLLSP